MATTEPSAAARAALTDRHAVEAARGVVGALLGPPHVRPFAIRYWTGDTEWAGQTAPPATLVLRSPDALRRMLLPPSELAVCEAYLCGALDVEGDAEAVVAGAETLVQRLGAAPLRYLQLVPRLLRLPAPARSAQRRRFQAPWLRRHALERDALAVRHHYDTGNDFYALWLDRRMVYSCAYFAQQDMDLDAAQEAKLDHICRKLQLRPGERLLDIGCGWGALVIYAAERYGVDATGITLSPEQATWAHQRIQQAGLADRCRVLVQDYRALPQDPVFDKAASVGMVEHVGKAMLPVYFARVFASLRPGGLFLNHGIVQVTRPRPVAPWLRPLWREGSFIQRYVFPDSELVSVGKTLAAAEAAGFEVRDVESLREHYATTLRHWLRRLEGAQQQAVALVGEETYRIWRLNMAGCARAFATGFIGVVQTLLAKQTVEGSVPLPATRAHLYAD